MFKYLFWFYFIVLGLFFTFVVPPFQKPDEGTHFNKALLISYGSLNCKQETFSYQQKYDLLRKDKHLKNIPFNDGGIMPVSLYKRSLLAISDEKQLVEGRTEGCQMPIVGYLPQALSLLIIRPLGFNHFVDFFSGRLAIFLVTIGFVIWLFKKVKEPIILYPLLLMLALPMSLYQLTSYSYDAVQLLLMAVYFVLIMKLKLGVIKDNKAWWLMMGIACLMLLSRKGTEPLIILMPLLLFNKDKKKQWFVWLIPLFLTVFFLITNLSLLGFESAKQVLDIHTDSQAQKQLMLERPDYFLTVLANTIHESQDFYIKSLVGKLGWLEYELPSWIYFFMALLFGWILFYLVSLGKKLASRFGYFDWLILLSILGSNYLYLMILEYLSWSPVGSHVVVGVQGRYFLYLLPVLIWFLVLSYLKTASRYFMLILVVVSILIGIFGVTIKRYYDYSVVTEKQSSFDLTEIDSYQTIILDDKQIWQTEVDFLSNKTLVGVEIYVRKPNKARDQSYLFELSDEKAKTVRMGFFREHDLQGRQHQLEIKPLKLKKYQKLFFTIKPYGQFTDKQRLRFYQLNSLPLYSLIYAL